MIQQHPSTPTAGPPRLSRLPALRREELRDELLNTVEHLHRRRASRISDGFIEDYVALNWLEWNAGALRLTGSGAAICDELKRLC